MRCRSRSSRRCASPSERRSETLRIGSSWGSRCSACSTEVAAERPLVCLVDDAQWLDEPSRQVLGFVGRRLLAEPVLLLLAVREAGDEQLFPALTSLTLEGLTEDDARALLTAAVPGQLDEQVRDRIVAETRGNPLRLLELPREMSSGELAGGYGVPHVGGPMEEHYTRRIRALPEPTQQLLLLAAADPTGDATLLWRAAETLGVPRSAAAAAESEQLIEIGSHVRFHHPLVRSAAYAARAAEDRCAAHSALAEATDVQVDPERRVWHLAAAATGPDEAVASELEADRGGGSGSRRVGGGGGVPRAVGPVDRRAAAPRRASPRRGARSSARRRLRRCSRLVGRGSGAGGRRRAAWREWNGSRARSSTRPTRDPRRRFSWWRPPGRWSGSTSSWRGRRTSTPGWRRTRPGRSLGPAVRCRRCRGRHGPLRPHQTGLRRVICSSTDLRRW